MASPELRQRRPKPPRRLAHETRIALIGLAAGSAGVFFALLLVWTNDYRPITQWTVTIVVVLVWLGFGLGLRDNVARPLQTLSNMLAGLREGDYSIRVRGSAVPDSLGELALETNLLTEGMREQRLGAVEAGALLTRVMGEIEVSIFAFDSDGKLRLVNRAGEKLLGQTAERLIGRSARELLLADYLTGETVRTDDRSFPGGSGRWGIRRSTFRQGGVPHDLLVVADLSRPLREEERQAWQRLVRVLGHELNNSLAPIKSIAESLEEMLAREHRPGDWEQDLRQGLRVISQRSDALSRFMRDYARLSRLPRPELQPVDLGELVRRVATLENRLPVRVNGGPPLNFLVDPVQLEQVLINLITNAVDASLESGGGVEVGWNVSGSNVELWVKDEGPGISNPANLFVPFFTTKQKGSGIGLALSRQIAEGHSGSLTLANRSNQRGCEARLRLPLRGPAFGHSAQQQQ